MANDAPGAIDFNAKMRRTAKSRKAKLAGVYSHGKKSGRSSQGSQQEPEAQAKEP
jgi:hypothetical protein